MKMNTKLSALTDDELLRQLSDMLQRSRRVESRLVAYINEVDARRLYAREGSPSMFQFCLDVLHLSEAEAYRRIAAARLVRKYPVILTMLEDGRLHLCGISLLKTHLTDNNYESVLARAAHKTKREIEVLVAELAPKPDVSPMIRKLPRRKKRPPSSVEAVPRKPVLPASPEERARVEPLAPARYRVQITAGAELREKLQRLQALLPGEDLTSAIDIAVSEKLERLEARRYGKAKRPRTTEAEGSSRGRYIPVAVKRLVWERDGGRCTFESTGGRRCSERHRLEYHHDEPYGLGGETSPTNLRLLCRAHNSYLAEIDYGYRHAADRVGVGEPIPVFRLRPGTVTGRIAS